MSESIAFNQLYWKMNIIFGYYHIELQYLENTITFSHFIDHLWQVILINSIKRKPVIHFIGHAEVSAPPLGSKTTEKNTNILL